MQMTIKRTLVFLLIFCPPINGAALVISSGVNHMKEFYSDGFPLDPTAPTPTPVKSKKENNSSHNVPVVSKTNHRRLLIAVLLDESRAEEAYQMDIIQLYNSFLEKQLDTANDRVMTRWLLIRFNEFTKITHIATPLADTPRLTVDDFHPYGETALFDSIVTGIQMADRVAFDGERVLFVILTNSWDKHSKKHGSLQVQQMIREKQSLGTWSFRYFGAVSARLKKLISDVVPDIIGDIPSTTINAVKNMEEKSMDHSSSSNASPFPMTRKKEIEHPVSSTTEKVEVQPLSFSIVDEGKLYDHTSLSTDSEEKDQVMSIEKDNTKTHLKSNDATSSSTPTRKLNSHENSENIDTPTAKQNELNETPTNDSKQNRQNAKDFVPSHDSYPTSPVEKKGLGTWSPENNVDGIASETTSSYPKTENKVKSDKLRSKLRPQRHRNGKKVNLTNTIRMPRRKLNFSAHQVREADNEGSWIKAVSKCPELKDLCVFNFGKKLSYWLCPEFVFDVLQGIGFCVKMFHHV